MFELLSLAFQPQNTLQSLDYPYQTSLQSLVTEFQVHSKYWLLCLKLFTPNPIPQSIVLDMSYVQDMSILCFDLNFNKIRTDRLGKVRLDCS